MTEFDARMQGLATDANIEASQLSEDDDNSTDGLQGLAAMVAGGRSVETVLGEVAGFAEQAIPNVDGAGVTLIRPTGPTMGIQTWSVTKPFVREIDLIQYDTLQEGPCLSCMQMREPMVSGHLGEDDRWPRFGVRVARLGVSSVLSLPLMIDEQVVGSINAYAYGRDAFGEHALRLGLIFARPAAVSVYNTQLLASARGLAEQLQQALSTRGVIDQAMGIIRARSGASADEAFDRLRRISQTENVKLAVVAQRLVDDAVRRATIRRR